jgi:hypothetical protein
MRSSTTRMAGWSPIRQAPVVCSPRVPLARSCSTRRMIATARSWWNGRGKNSVAPARKAVSTSAAVPWPARAITGTHGWHPCAVVITCAPLSVRFRSRMHKSKGSARSRAHADSAVVATTASPSSDVDTCWRAVCTTGSPSTRRKRFAMPFREYRRKRSVAEATGPA